MKYGRLEEDPLFIPGTRFTRGGGTNGKGGSRYTVIWEETLKNAFRQKRTIPGRQIAVATKTFFKLATKICGFSVRNLLRVTLLAAGITGWLLAFSKNSASLRLGYFCSVSNPIPSSELDPLNGFFLLLAR